MGTAGGFDYVPRDRILGASRAVAPADYLALRAALDQEQTDRKMMFFHGDEGIPRHVQISLMPWFLTDAQREYFRRYFLAVDEATRLLYPFARANAEAKRLLPVSEGLERWMRDCIGDPVPHQTFVGRIDASVRWFDADWKDSFRLIETNMVGIGATYYSYAAGQAARACLAPRYASLGGRLENEDDILELIQRQVISHGEAIGLRRFHVGWTQDDRVQGGPEEYHTVCDILRGRGYHARVTDPRDVTLRDGQLWHGDWPVDLLYRDPTVDDLLEMESEGADLSAVKWAFKNNRVVSSLLGEYDHKGVLELFTWPAFQKLMSPESRDLLLRHTAWTRVVRETRTTALDGREVDLLPWIRENRAKLLLKPNRDYGGHGLVFGEEVDSARWDAAVEESLADDASTVVQEVIPPVKLPFPRVVEGRVQFDEMFIVSGFTGTPRGEAMLARMSLGRIVNITRDGGIAGVLVPR